MKKLYCFTIMSVKFTSSIRLEYTADNNRKVNRYKPKLVSITIMNI